MKKQNFLKAALVAVLMMGTMYMSMAQYVYETFYSESFGTTTTTTAISAHTDYDVTTVTYSSSTNTVSIRATSPSIVSDVPQYEGASGGALVYMGQAAGPYFQIDGLNTEGYDKFELRYGMRKNAVAANMNSLRVEYSTDGETWTLIPQTDWDKGVDSTYVSGTTEDFPTGTGTAGWYRIICAEDANTIPASSNLSLRFTLDSAFQTRIDDITLIGARPVPYLVINAPAEGNYGPCDSLELDLTIGNFDLSTVIGGYVMEKDGFLKIESELLSNFGLPSPYYASAIEYMALSSFGKFTLPDGNYNLTVTLVDNDSLPLVPAVTETINISVETPATEAPVFTPEAGSYHTPQTIELTCATEDAAIYYTLDGSEPDAENGILYTEPIEFNDTMMTVKAIAIAECHSESEITEATFTQDVTGIASFNASNIHIAPNPATSVLNVSAKGFNQVEVLNFLGQVVYKSNISNDEIQINLNDIEAGVYFVRLQNENNIVTKKFIKK